MKYIKSFVLIAVLLIGCNTNFFSPLRNPENSTSLTVLLSEGDAALENCNYTDAMKYYHRAYELFPASGKARLGYCAAYVANENMNILDLYRVLDSDTATDTSPIFPRDDITSIDFYYRVASVVDEYLTPIIDGNTDLPKHHTETNLNIAFSSILLGALVVYDSDGNGRFDDPNIDVLYLGRDLQVGGFENFTGLADPFKRIIVENLSNRIDIVVDIIEKCTKAITVVIENLDLDHEDPALIDDLKTTATEAKEEIMKYRYWLDVNLNGIKEGTVWFDDNSNMTIDDADGEPWTYEKVKALINDFGPDFFDTDRGEWTGGDWGWVEN